MVVKFTVQNAEGNEIFSQEVEADFEATDINDYAERLAELVGTQNEQELSDFTITLEADGDTVYEFQGEMREADATDVAGQFTSYLYGEYEDELEEDEPEDFEGDNY
jgi:hypothetical protein